MMNSDKDWPLEPFNDSLVPSDLRREWEEWLRAFELIVELRKIESQHEKFILLMARGGRGLQRIYCNLRPVAGEITPDPVKVPLILPETPEYDNAVKRLNHFFVGKRNERIELEVFRSMKQLSDEPFSYFILRLRTQATRCDFRSREEIEILHQVAMGARDEHVRDKGLEDSMCLDDLTNYAMNREMLQKLKEKVRQCKNDEDDRSVAVVKQDWRKKPKFNSSFRENRWGQIKHTEVECGNCGSWKHSKESRECSARKARCNKCGRTQQITQENANQATTLTLETQGPETVPELWMLIRYELTINTVTMRSLLRLYYHVTHRKYRR
ncbi:uncharacterized protein LOC131435411 [Malaya genurostris]|uniref:uncharacterized protein LOC131435411 n=1 Tax=Malaya genurostris TaxID=325434 RepID=UPI0026F3DCE3|nr:uncharacterized protein LOC131435411 [Malaya genurostris]